MTQVASTRLTLSVKGKKKQRLLRGGKLTIRARCNADCRLRLRGKVRVAGARKGFKVKASRRLTAGKRVVLRVRLSKRALKKTRAAVAHGKRVKIILRGNATGVAGKAKAKRVKIVVRGAARPKAPASARR